MKCVVINIIKSLCSMQLIAASIHCVKSVQIRSLFWSILSCIRTEYEDLLFKSRYSIPIQENTDQKKLRTWPLFTQ